MTAKKKIDHIISTSNISEFIEISQVTDAQKAIAQKDAHVVDAALSIKSIIASNDNAARAVLKFSVNFQEALANSYGYHQQQNVIDY